MKKVIVLLCAFLLCSSVSSQTLRAAVRVDIKGVDVDTNQKMSTMPQSLYTDCVLWPTFSKEHLAGVYDDFSTEKNDGTNITAGLQPAHTNDAGGAYDFDGDDFIGQGNPASIQFTNTFSISAWISTTQANNRIVSKDDVLVNRAYMLRMTGDQPEVSIWQGGTRQFALATNEISDSEWHHIVGVNDGTNLLIYVDGVLENTAAGEGGSVDNDPAELLVGRRGGVNPLPFIGLLDEPTLFSRGLSTNEVTDLYLSGSTNGTGAH